MSKKKKQDENRDEGGITAEGRAIIDSIDYEKIAADAVADMEERKDEIHASAMETARKKVGEGVGKTRNSGIISLVISIVVLIGGILSLNAGVGLYLIIAGVLILLYSICMFSIAKSNKKFAANE